MTTGLVIVETRSLSNIREIVENHIHFTGWGVTFFHGLGNKEFVESELKGLDVTFFNLRVSELNEQGYNKLLTYSFFWEQIPYDKVLIFQHDSLLLRKGIEEFLEWDYIGAPWLWQKHGGNGGLSLRSKSAMLSIIESKPYKNQTVDGNEDVYFCNAIYKNPEYKLAPPSVCSQFACEAIYKLGTFGVHDIWKWLSRKQCEEILTQYKLVVSE